jgi:hypothetical protein
MHHSKPPKRWIGVHADWKLKSDNPLEHLVALTPRELSTHGLFLGKTGMGKTTLIHHIIAQDLSRGHGLCILDLRGDLITAAVELCAKLTEPKKVRIIDLREGATTSGFNPLFGSGPTYFRALSVLAAISRASESFGVQLAETLMYGLLALTEAGATLPDLEPLFYDPVFRSGILAKVTTDRVRAFWDRYDCLSTERQATLAMPVLNKVSMLYATPSLQQILGEPSPFDLQAHLNEPGSVLLVSLAGDQTHDAGVMMGSILLASVCREVFARVSVPENQRAPLRIIVDEFENFECKEFEQLLAEGRRLKASLLLAHQTLSQTSPRLRSLVLGNVGVKGIFGLGREDSAAMSKDLFGSPIAYDFTDTPRGYMVLERRDQPTIAVEVNEPLFRNLGALSPKATGFLKSVPRLAPKRELDMPSTEQFQPEPAPEFPSPQVERPSTLGDWL